MKIALAAFALLFSSYFSSYSYAGPMVSGGGFAQLIASCSSNQYDVSIVRYDQELVFRVRAANAGVYDHNLVLGDVLATVPTANAVYEAEYADQAGRLEVGLLKGTAGQNRQMILIHVQLDSGEELNNLPVDCSYPAAPQH